MTGCSSGLREAFAGRGTGKRAEGDGGSLLVIGCVFEALPTPVSPTGPGPGIVREGERAFSTVDPCPGTIHFANYMQKTVHFYTRFSETHFDWDSGKTERFLRGFIAAALNPEKKIMV